MRGARPTLLLVAILIGAARAEADPPACTPRAAEQDGVRFVSVCPAGFWITATPVPCGSAERASAACDPVTALEASSLAAASKNHSVEAWVTDAASAARTCKRRFGGRLPTPLEREQARLALGLASLRVREESGEFARLRLHAQREWVVEDGRATRYPNVATPPLPGGDVLLVCVAEPAMPQAHSVPIGESCDERPEEAGVRSPNCAVGVPGTHARFELGCAPERVVHSHARTEDAAFRCVAPSPR
jgi:hypothetical protein